MAIYRRRTAIAAMTAAMLVFSTSAGAQADPSHAEPPTDPSVAQLSESDLAYVGSFLAYIDEIPDEVVENGSDEDVAAYLQEHQPGQLDSPNPILMNYNAWECAGAIALIIGGTVVPIAKGVNVVRLVKSIGGAKKVGRAIDEAGGIKEILRTKGKSVKSEDIRDALFSIASELSGIGLAVEKC